MLCCDARPSPETEELFGAPSSGGYVTRKPHVVLSTKYQGFWLIVSKQIKAGLEKVAWLLRIRLFFPELGESPNLVNLFVCCLFFPPLGFRITKSKVGCSVYNPNTDNVELCNWALL